MITIYMIIIICKNILLYLDVNQKMMDDLEYITYKIHTKFLQLFYDMKLHQDKNN